MSRRSLIMVAALGSAALLLGAWGFQALGYAPCKMCLWQRWPHAAAFVIGMLALFTLWRPLLLLGAMAALTTGAIGIYHTGVEKKWWQGPDTCTSGDISNLSTDQLMDQILGAPLVQCDVVAWQFATLSMASWNAVLSFVLVGIWLAAWLAR
ncbi:MAG: disulfide bond formation protein B [Paracoccaceae bacterium]